ncbi:DUF4326 domain-containing protein [Nakamurella leprariae]|uniref:DUF4326 domain-containing protein n=1 Tax=Nakamurella leprariae TaxID=2803911 RepID=A0A938Y7K9_9ACTN|nr:DUF4326 domain-containing protein [Nakamurella leprariae]MBM9467295.1 DUF4326 domain-containing protein [Nakamurella leprariae]
MSNERAASTVRAGGPRRVQLHRTRGWRKPPGVVVVARPSRWGNPFRLSGPDRVVDTLGDEPVVITCSRGASRATAVAMFRAALRDGELPFDGATVVAELSGHDLACWCPLLDADGAPVPCHADVLLEVANAGRPR